MHMIGKRGFTLIELLVVISIISMLASIILVSLQSARDKAGVGAGQVFDDHVYHYLGVNAAGLWNFDEGSGAAIVDSSGNNNNGTINGSVTRTSGVSQGALNFSNGYVLIPTPNTLSSLGDNFTVTAWINTTTLAARQTIFNIGSGGGVNREFALGIATGGATGCPAQGGLEAYKPGFWVACSAGLLKANAWINIAYTKNGSGDAGTFYMNGQAVPTTYASPTSFGIVSSNQYTGLIGERGDIVFPFSGSMDGVRVYSQTLATEEIRDIYAMGLPTHSLAAR